MFEPHCIKLFYTDFKVITALFPKKYFTMLKKWNICYKSDAHVININLKYL